MEIKSDWVTKHCEPKLHYSLDISPTDLAEQLTNEEVKNLFFIKFSLDKIPAPQEKGILTEEQEKCICYTCQEICKGTHTRNSCPLYKPQEKELPNTNNTVDGQSLRRDINSILDYLKKQEG